MLSEQLIRNRAALQQEWTRRILDGYHSRTQKFLSSIPDAFDNPVGGAIAEATEAILDHLLEGGEPGVLGDRLQHFVRIRAVQDFSCGDAVGFVFQLKEVVREQLGGRVRKAGAHDELLQLESAIDGVAVVCFEKFVEAREELFHIQTRSIRRETHMLVDRMNRMSAKLNDIAIDGEGKEDEDNATDVLTKRGD